MEVPRQGYAHPSYAAALVHVGTARSLPGSAGSVVLRPIGAGGVDAAGPYPLFACADWHALADDIETHLDDVVSLVLVADPFGSWTPELLARLFPDLCAPYKEHVVVDLARPPLVSATGHHRRDAARALRVVTVETVEPLSFVDDWDRLYQALVARHGIKGAAAFPRASFELQVQVPGVVALRATRGGETVAGALWYEDDGVAYYHLAAATVAGYRAGASYALVATALQHFAERGVAWAELGGGTNGLGAFKRGWSPLTRTAYLCGRVLDRHRYEELAAGGDRSFFPAYRLPD